MKEFEYDRCDYCERADGDPDCGLYRAKCRGCTVRAFANCPQFFDSAKDAKLTPAYKHAMEAAFGDDWRQAHDDEVKPEAARIRALRAARKAA